MINLKARLSNKTFWVSTVSTGVLLAQQLGVTNIPSNWSEVLNTGLSLLILLGIIVDTSTTGIGDKVEPIVTTTVDTGTPTFTDNTTVQ